MKSLWICLPNQTDMLTTKFNTEIINQVRAETTALVKEHLEHGGKGRFIPAS